MPGHGEHVPIQEIFRVIYHSSQDAMGYVNLEGHFLDFNDAFLSLAGYSRKELLQKRLWDITPAEYHELQRQVFEEILRTGKPTEYEKEYVRKDGLRIPVSFTTFLVKEADGQPIGYAAVVKDITERKQAEAASHRQRALLAVLSRLYREALLSASPEKASEALLAEAERLTGSKMGFVGELNQAGRFDTFSISTGAWEACQMPEPTAWATPRDMEVRGLWGKVLEEGRSLIVNDPTSHPERVGTPKGHPRLTSFLGVPLRREGKTIGMIGLANKESGYDLSDQQDVEALALAFAEALEHQRANLAQRTSARQWQTTFDAIGDGICLLDTQNRVVQCNAAMVKLLEKPRAEIIGHTCWELVHDASQPIEGCPIVRLRESQHRESQVLRQGQRWLNITVDPLFAADGSLAGAVHTISDITELKQAEEKMRQRDQELSALYAALLAITQTLDLDQVMRELIQQAGKALGSAYTSIVLVNPDGSLGMGAEDFAGIPPLAYRTRPGGVTRRIITTGQPVLIEDVDADTNTNPVLVDAGIKSYAGVPLRSRDTTIGVLFVHSLQRNAFGDRMDLLTAFAGQAALAIENARLYREAGTAGALRETDRLKSELLSNVSHELRTPLASVKGYSSLLLSAWQKIPDEEKRDFVHEIDQASDRLRELIENLLDLSRLESGGLSIRKEPIDLAHVVNIALTDIQRKARRHHFTQELAQPLPLVEADPRRIRQVLDNLLDNAVKYSREGTEIALRCEIKGQELATSVRDQGIGISAEDLEKIFDRFYRVDLGSVWKAGGAGLGLSICRRIVEAHGGSIWAESTPGQGSTLTFTLPLMDQKGDGSHVPA